MKNILIGGCLLASCLRSIASSPVIEKRWSYGTDWVTEFTTVTVEPSAEPSDDADTITQTELATEYATQTQTQTESYTTTVTNWLPSPTASAGTLLITITQQVYQDPYAVTETVYMQEQNEGDEITTTYVDGDVTTTYVTAGGVPPTGDGSGWDDEDYDSDVCNGIGEKEPGTLSLTPLQRTTLFAFAIMVLASLLAWNFFLLRSLLFPLKMLTVTIHEMGHCLGALSSGYHIAEVTFDPSPGGRTQVLAEGDQPLVNPVAMYPLGFFFSGLFGGLFVFCGFNTLASKVASFFVGIGLLFVLYRGGDIWTRIHCLIHIGLMIGFWFIDHASVLRYYILLVGVLSSFYIIYDTIDDMVFSKPNPCCVITHMEKFGPRIPIIGWFMGYFLFCMLFLAGFILAAIAAFRQTSHGMYCQAQTFLPT